MVGSDGGFVRGRTNVCRRTGTAGIHHGADQAVPAHRQDRQREAVEEGGDDPFTAHPASSV